MSLEPRIIQGLQAQYDRAQYPGSNPSGFRPIGTQVLVLMDTCSQQTTGAVHLPTEMIEKMDHASESGVLIAGGDAAFRFYDDGSRWVDYKPQPGDRVFTEKYAGRELRGRDGKTYRMMTYTCIGGIEEAEVQAAVVTSKRKKR